jgi:hypothetical protein
LQDKGTHLRESVGISRESLMPGFWIASLRANVNGGEDYP